MAAEVRLQKVEKLVEVRGRMNNVSHQRCPEIRISAKWKFTVVVFLKGVSLSIIKSPYFTL